MQINRLDLRVLPPVAPGAVDVAVSTVEANATRSTSVRSGAAQNAAPVTTPAVAATPADKQPVPTPAQPGVTLELSGNTASDTQHATYSADGLMFSRPRLVVDQTPAEQFVASAVNIIRAYEESKSTAAGAAQGGSSSVGGLLGGLRQVVGKLHLFA